MSDLRTVTLIGSNGKRYEVNNVPLGVTIVRHGPDVFVKIQGCSYMFKQRDVFVTEIIRDV